MGTGFYLASSTLNIAFMAMLLWRANSLPSWARLRIRHKARLSGKRFDEILIVEDNNDSREIMDIGL